MGKQKVLRVMSLAVALGLPIVLAPSVFAAPAAEVTQVENFIKNIIQAMSVIAGLVAVVYFIVGGYTYITSSGNPDHLDKAKRTLKYSAIGLVIVIAAFSLASFIGTTAKGAFGG